MTDNKLAKRSVHFRQAKPSGPRCGTCIHFTSKTASCILVAGSVKSGDLCDRYAAGKGR